MSQSVQQTRIAEFDWLKVLGLILLIFVHSNLGSVYPSIINPVQWILISCFFFVSGYLAFSSFHKRENSIKSFFKTKFFSLYIPFALAAIFYYNFEVYLGASSGGIYRLLSHVSLLAVFDKLNEGLFNLGFLWFIPYLLVFFLVFCLIEKYIKNVKIQIAAVFAVWFLSVLAWVFNEPFKLGFVFSQYLLVFMAGLWVKKFNIYDKYIGVKMAALVVALLALFSFDFSYLFNYSSALNALASLLYTNARSVFLSLSVIFLVLALLKGRVSRNRAVESIAVASILIYLTEPFVSYLVRVFVFGGQLDIYVANLPNFLLYQALRFAVLFGFLPLLYIAVKRSEFFSKITNRLNSKLRKTLFNRR
jgi:hypothetical protein